MATIHVIKPSAGRIAPRKKVAAYARVSLETEQLMHSLSAQISHYSNLIQSNPDWEYAGVYADEGISGRQTALRKEFLRLMADCEAGKIDIVLTKSVSRFARDTVDCLNAVRHLKEIGVEVRFEREGVSTFTADGELLLTLLASFAQAESESIGANVRWATRKKFEEGIPNGHKAPYGYRWDGEMFRILPEQGKVVKYIYERYLAGDSACKIAKSLKEQGIPGQSGKPMCDSTVKDILTSPSYMGTMILQKNFMSEAHTRRRNKGELPRYAVTEMFEPLVSEEDFNRAVAIRKQRAEALPDMTFTRFSGLVKCGDCGGGISRRTIGNRKRWVCNARERKGTCDAKPISEEELSSAAEKAVGKITDEEFRRTVTRIEIFGDRIDFYLANGRKKTVPRDCSHPYTNKIYCAKCGKKCKRCTYSSGTKSWRCENCRLGLRETDLQTVSAVFFGENWSGQIIEKVKRIDITEASASYTLKDGRILVWQKQ